MRNRILFLMIFSLLFPLGMSAHTINAEIEILGENIDSYRRTSAYQSHKVYLNTTSSVKAHKWLYKLPLASGEDTLIATSEETVFNIPAITNLYKYKHSGKSEIQGEILFTGLVNDIEIKETYNIILELKPQIISAEIVERTECSLENEFYSLTIKVKYEGANHIEAFLEEEDSPYITMYTSTIPHETDIKINNINGWGWANIELSTDNEYGKDTFIIELPSVLTNNINSATSNDNLCIKIIGNELFVETDVPCSMNLNDISGKLIQQTKNNRIDISSLPKGVYIIAIRTGKGTIIKKIAL